MSIAKAPASRPRSTSKTRKSVATRERIMAAASELMVERRSTDFQMSEVSARCKMSKGSLYYYFSDRDELIQAIFSASSDELVSSIERLVSQAATAQEALEGLCEDFASRMRVGSPLALAMTRELALADGGVLPMVSSHLSAVVRILTAQFDRAKHEGLVREDLDSSSAAVFVAGGFMASSLAFVESSDADGREALSRRLFDICMHGIGVRA